MTPGCHLDGDRLVSIEQSRWRARLRQLARQIEPDRLRRTGTTNARPGAGAGRGTPPVAWSCALRTPKRRLRVDFPADQVDGGRSRRHRPHTAATSVEPTPWSHHSPGSLCRTDTNPVRRT